MCRAPSAHMRRPSTWGFHDYHDVIFPSTEFPDGEDAHKFVEFTGGIRSRGQIWIGEAAVELQNGKESTGLATGSATEQQDKQIEAAHRFEKLHKASSRIERIYYYGYRAPTEAEQLKGEKEKELPFDSGLFEAEPEPSRPEGERKSKDEARPAYCVLAFADHSCAPTVRTIFGFLNKEGKKTGSGINAIVDPNGLATKLYFQYGKSGEEGYPHSTTPESIGAGLVSELWGGSGLTSGIHFRAVAENADGTRYGEEESCEFG